MPADLPGRDHAGRRPPASPAAAEIEWQRFFADARLKRLIALALANNRDLRIAVLNIEQTRALYDVRRADAAADRRRRRQRAPAPPPAPAASAPSTPSALAVTGYELDLFGRVRA